MLVILQFISEMPSRQLIFSNSCANCYFVSEQCMYFYLILLKSIVYSIILKKCILN